MLNHKRIMSLVLAGAMAASLAIPAFAADSTESTTNRSLKIDGTYQAVDIAVVVPATGTVTINPYALPVKIGTDANEKDIKVDKQQIVTQPVTIKNQSEVKLDVNVTATATVKGNLTLLTAPSADYTKETKNTAFLYLVAENTTLAGAADADAVNAAAIADAWSKQEWTAYSTGESAPGNIVAMTKSGTAATKAGITTLAAAKMDEDSGKFSEYDEGSIAFLNVSGGCAQNPTTAWTTKDGVSIVVAFTFTPNVAD